MKHYSFIRMLYALTVIILAAPIMTSAQESYDGNYMISELMNEARDKFDLSHEDAVLLLDSERRTLDMDGRWSIHIHRVIWISTAIGIRRYGDHRINYDSERCEFKDITVRTWRDGQWWVTGETGIVETLPYSVRSAYDYAGLRDMMLLHNGIEIPCILELAYTVQYNTTDALKKDGLRTFAGREPAVKSIFELSLPSDIAERINVTSNIKEAPATTPRNGMTIRRWEGNFIDAARQIDSPGTAMRKPHLIWSAWTGWDELGNTIRELLDKNTSEQFDWADARDSLEINSRSELELAQMIASYIGTTTRYVNIDRVAQWYKARPATRVYETAYASKLDRVILAMAMLRTAGFNVEPVFFAQRLPDGTPPSLSVFDDFGLLASKGETVCYYNPVQSKAYKGKHILDGKSQWRPGIDGKPSFQSDINAEESRVIAQVHLKYDKDSTRFTGKAFVSVDNCANPYAQIAGLDDKCTGFLSSVLGKAISGIKVKSYNPSRFDEDEVTFGVNIEIPKPEKDSLGRMRLNFGDALALIEDRLDLKIPLYIQKLVSTIEFVCPVSVAVQVNLDLEGLEVVYEPVLAQTQNALGDYSLTLDRAEDRLVVRKKLELRHGLVEPGHWTLLRDLLAGAAMESGSLILVKPSD